ncbi:MAG TPA: hypothetical protein VK858_19785 [Longimicrobiales bacterium]|nr:hypothetical protein [Longimicrobiales bacterium]
MERTLIRIGPAGIRVARLGVLAALATVAAVQAGPAAAQLPASPTLRWGSGYLDVPSATALPGAGVRATFSGFWTRVSEPPLVGDDGTVMGTGEPRNDFHGDMTVGLGLFDRLELGASLQSIRSDEEGGDLWGFHGRVLLVRPEPGGLGVAVGARVLTTPDFEDGVEGAPGRLGFPDSRLRREYTDGTEVRTRFSPWVVATWAVPGPQAAWLPPNDLTLTAGWGGGIFREGEDLGWYAGGVTDGWLVAGSWGFVLGDEVTMGLEAEHNGFDVNAGLELNWRGARLGVHALGLNHREAVSEYRSRKWGVSLSLEACPLLGRACRPRVRRPEVGDTIRLPAPPPDTVRIRVPVDTAGPGEGVAAEDAAGRAVRLCLATGQDLWLRVGARDARATGDPRYAGASAPARLELDGRTHEWDGEEVNPLCAALEPAGRWGEVPLYRPREGGGSVVLLPVAPGRWRTYRVR